MGRLLCWKLRTKKKSKGSGTIPREEPLPVKTVRTSERMPPARRSRRSAGRLSHSRGGAMSSRSGCRTGAQYTGGLLDHTTCEQLSSGGLNFSGSYLDRPKPQCPTRSPDPNRLTSIGPVLIHDSFFGFWEGLLRFSGFAPSPSGSKNSWKLCLCNSPRWQLAVS